MCNGECVSARACVRMYKCVYILCPLLILRLCVCVCASVFDGYIETVMCGKISPLKMWNVVCCGVRVHNMLHMLLCVIAAAIETALLLTVRSLYVPTYIGNIIS